MLLALAAAPAARAADFDDPYPRRPPPDWAFRHGPGPHGPCRVLVEPGHGPFGWERARRVRVCDGAFRGPPRWSRGGEPPLRDAYEPHERPPLAPEDAAED